MKKYLNKYRQIDEYGSNKNDQNKPSTSSAASAFNTNNIVKIEMANDELENVEIEEIDEETDNGGILQANIIESENSVKNKTKKVTNTKNVDGLNGYRLNSLEAIKDRLERGCECTNSCFDDIDPNEVYKHRLNIAELTKNEHEMYLMGITMGCIANCKTTHHQSVRQRQRATYAYRGKRVCLDAFLFLENVTLYHIKRIRNHVLTHGVTPRIHGNVGKKAHNTFSLDVYETADNYVREFLKNHVSDFDKKQTIFGFNRTDIYNSYRKNGGKPLEKLMGYSKFRVFMKMEFPQLKFRRYKNATGPPVPKSTNNKRYRKTRRKRIRKVIKSEEILPSKKRRNTDSSLSSLLSSLLSSSSSSSLSSSDEETNAKNESSPIIKSDDSDDEKKVEKTKNLEKSKMK